jgi:hypothetical protein
MKTPVEVIPLAECLTRLNLADLIDQRTENLFVGWSGYPKPFPCGHTDVYGFGPMRRDGYGPDAKEVENDRKGSGREYQMHVRVNQYLCSGEVLFSFPRYSKSYATGEFYEINSSVVISIDEIPDSKSTCLKVCITA